MHRALTSLSHAARDVRQGWRTICRMPGLAAVVVLSLGVGIGVNTAVFSWVQAVVLRPLPGVRDAADFHLVEPRAESGSYPGASWLEYQDLRERLRSFRDLVVFRMVPLIVGERDRTERAYGLLVSGNYFAALGLRPALGRFFQPDEVARPGGEPVVVLSYGFWRTRYAGAASALGQTLRVNERELTVVGVAPRGFQGTVLGLDFDLWVPATLAPALLGGSRELEERGLRGYSVMGRLRPRATRAEAQADVDAAMRQLGRLYPESNATTRAEVLPFWQAPRGPQRFLARALMMLQGVLLLLLLAVCANTANLVLARATARQREVGVRRALGASRWRIVCLLLTENLLLALLGAGLGVAIAVWGATGLRAVPLPGGLPISFRTGVDAAGLAFSVLLGLACGVAFGLGPAVQLARLDPQLALRSGARTAGRSPLRSALVAGEVALALVVLVAAALFLRSFQETRETDPGFRREGVLLAAYDRSGRQSDAASNRDFAARVLERLRASPGVEAAAVASSVPLDIHGMPARPFTLEGHARSGAGDDAALVGVVTPGYFRTMGIPLVAGADFTALADTAPPPQAVVNEAFVGRYLDGAEPLGRRVRVGDRGFVIAGVVRNSAYDSFGERPQPAVFLSYRDWPAAVGQIHVRTRPGAEMALAPELRRVVRDLDPALPIYDVRTLGEHVERNLVFRRIPARLFVVLGPLLLLLAAVGIYAVVAYAVARRTAEIGIRLALGGTARRIVAQIVGENLRVVGYGVLAGWLVVLVVAMHVARGRPISASVFLGVPALLLLVATVACWLPARRAARVDPMVALREE